jgi:hypothetical protein
MQSRIAFCSTCNRDVHMVITDGPSHDGHANLHDADLVCLDVGDDCTGTVCPVCETSPTVMAARLARNDLLSCIHPEASLECKHCGRVTTHVTIERHFATCSECGATTDRSPAIRG